MKNKIVPSNTRTRSALMAVAVSLTICSIGWACMTIISNPSCAKDQPPDCENNCVSIIYVPNVPNASYCDSRDDVSGTFECTNMVVNVSKFIQLGVPKVEEPFGCLWCDFPTPLSDAIPVICTIGELQGANCIVTYP